MYTRTHSVMTYGGLGHPLLTDVGMGTDQLIIWKHTSILDQWLIHILLWNSYFRRQIFALQFPPLLAPHMLEILNSFDNTTYAWPEDMTNCVTGLGEWTLT